MRRLPSGTITWTETLFEPRSSSFSLVSPEIMCQGNAALKQYPWLWINIESTSIKLNFFFIWQNLFKEEQQLSFMHLSMRTAVRDSMFPLISSSSGKLQNYTNHHFRSSATSLTLHHDKQRRMTGRVILYGSMKTALLPSVYFPYKERGHIKKTNTQ